MSDQQRAMFAGRGGLAGAMFASDGIGVGLGMSDEVAARTAIRFHLELVHERAAHGPIELALGEARCVDRMPAPGDRPWLRRGVGLAIGTSHPLRLVRCTVPYT